MTESLAAVFDGTAGKIALRRLPTPRPHAGEILVRVTGCTLCGSDLHSFSGRRTVPVPTVLGHEIVGEIIAVGDQEERRDLAGRALQVGDHVTWAIVAHCSSCFYCQNGLPQKCLRGVKYGHEALRPGRELLGGLAEHCLLTPGTALVRLPDDLPLAVACPAGCATATIAAAMEAAHHSRSDARFERLAVFGAGMLGLTACAMARSLGVGQIVCIDPVPERRQRALAFGATRAVAPEDFAAVAAATASDFGFDAVLELSGSSAAFDAAWPALRVGGTLVLVGAVFPGPPATAPIEQFVRRCLTIRGVHNYAPRHLLTAVDFLAAQHHHFPFVDLVTQWFPLTEIAAAFSASEHQAAIRIGVDPTGAVAASAR